MSDENVSYLGVKIYEEGEHPRHLREAREAEASEAAEDERPSLSQMNRAEMDDYATELGLDPDDYSNMDELREAIEAELDEE